MREGFSPLALLSFAYALMLRICKTHDVLSFFKLFISNNVMKNIKEFSGTEIFSIPYRSDKKQRCQTLDGFCLIVFDHIIT